MLRPFCRTAAVVAALLAMYAPLQSLADNGTGDVFQAQIVPGANTGIKNALDQEQQRRAKARLQASQSPASQTVGQVQEIGRQETTTRIGLPTGFTYQADLSIAYPYGNIGTYGKQWLTGGGDLAVGYGFNWSTRVVASMYQLQHWPYGFNSGLAPVYLAGFRNPIGCADLSGGTACGAGTGRNLNVNTKDTFGVFMLQKLFLIQGLPRPLPIVVSPVYVARSGQIGFTNGDNDVVPFTYNLPDGPVINVPARTAQYYAVAVTLPFLKTPKMFGTFTVAPQWLVHTNGANVGNSMQLPQVLYLEYTPMHNTTIFFEPQSARDYLPTDPYPEHLIAYFLGVSQRVTKYGFVQLVLNSGNPTNLGPDGIVGIKCLTVQQILTNACGLAVGGLKATQLQLQFGVGSPSVFPL